MGLPNYLELAVCVYMAKKKGRQKSLQYFIAIKIHMYIFQGILFLWKRPASFACGSKYLASYRDSSEEGRKLAGRLAGYMAGLTGRLLLLLRFSSTYIEVGNISNFETFAREQSHVSSTAACCIGICDCGC